MDEDLGGDEPAKEEEPAQKEEEPASKEADDQQ